LDEQLRLHGIKPERLEGYGQVQTNHLSVAAKIAAGEADVGIGTEKAALLVGQVEFIPLIQEQYDLVMLNTPDNLAWINSLKHILQSDAFRQELQALAGYDLTLTGQVLLET
jgi:putative molybdopterin biosynthesis protein